MNDERRWISVPTGDGQFKLARMTDEQHEAFEAELLRSDFPMAHGLITPELFDSLWNRQQGLCAVCQQPLDPAVCMYEEGESLGIHCEDCSSILTVRRIDNPASFLNDAASQISANAGRK